MYDMHLNLPQIITNDIQAVDASVQSVPTTVTDGASEVQRSGMIITFSDY